ncbi:MAG TPA: hypothetical protein VLL82_06395, partial [Mycobacterium sp.]|nr:hypothetical protein [Mycobacterium sp.]
MATYQAISTTAVTSAPQTDPAPVILHDDGGEDDGHGIIDNDGGNPHQASWWVNRVTEVTQTLGRDLAEFQTNPAQAISDLISDIPALIADEIGHLGEALQAFPELAALPFAVPAVFAGGFAPLIGLAAIQPEAAAPSVAAAPMPQAPSVPAVMGSAPAPMGAAAAAAPAPSSAPTSAPAPAPTSVSATGAPPPPAGIGGAPYPYLVGGPTVGSSTGMSSSAQRKAQEPDSAAAATAAAAAAREKQQARRRRRAAMKDRYRGYEFMDLDSDSGAEPDPSADQGKLATSAVASDHGAGSLGFAGTTRTDAAPAAGLTTLADGEFGHGPSVPMVPGTWEPDQREPDEGDQS